MERPGQDTRRRSAVLLSDILKRALPDAARERIYSVELLRRQWERAVGHELARRSEPESLDDGILTVRVVDLAWGRMIVKLQHRIVSSVNRAVGSKMVRRVRFVLREELRNQPPAREETATARRGSPPPPPPPPVSAALEEIPDKDLREMLRRSASLYFQGQRARAVSRSRSNEN